jgi:hypothetical protein
VPQETKKVVLLHLEGFALQASSIPAASCSVSAILNPLVMPRLRTLSVKALPLDSESDSHISVFLPVKDLLSRSSCLLDRLALFGSVEVPAVQDTMIDCLKMSPHLSQLILDDRPDVHTGTPPAVLFGEDVIRTLMITGDAPLCPRLEKLGFCDRSACDVQLIVDLLQSRFTPTPPEGVEVAVLKSATIYSYRLRGELEPKLEPLQTPEKCEEMENPPPLEDKMPFWLTDIGRPPSPVCFSASSYLSKNRIKVFHPPESPFPLHYDDENVFDLEDGSQDVFPYRDYF